jgi:hypothetical protein
VIYQQGTTYIQPNPTYGTPFQSQPTNTNSTSTNTNTGATTNSSSPQTSASEADAKPIDEFVVNIPKGNGEYTTVRLKKTKDGYIGPQGELYSEFPKVEQLKAMYANQNPSTSK